MSLPDCVPTPDNLTVTTYDAAGRMTSAQGQRGLTSLAWDGLSRLVAATSAEGSGTTQAAYAYDHAGRMLVRDETTAAATAASLFLPFALTQETAAIYDPAGEGPGTLTYSFVCGPSGTRLAQTDYAPEPDATAYPFSSPRGDVLALMGEGGSITSAYAYEPYGEMEEGYSAEGTPFLYQDDYLDPSTELYHMQARWYDPASALFASPDPAMGDATDPTLRYPYAYCAGDPVYNSDPSGERLVEGNDPSIELHYTMASLQASARRRGIPTSRAAREKSAHRQKVIQKRALWKATEPLRRNIRPQDMSASTIERMQAQGIDPTEFKQYLFPRLQDALGAGSYAEVTSIIIEMGESGSFTEQDVRYFLSRTTMNQRMQNEYVNVFHQAERGSYEKGSTWGELFKGETWKEALPTIIRIEKYVLLAGSIMFLPVSIPAAGVVYGFHAATSAADTGIGVNQLEKKLEKREISEYEYQRILAKKLVLGILGAIFPPFTILDDWTDR